MTQSSTARPETTGDSPARVPASAPIPSYPQRVVALRARAEMLASVLEVAATVAALLEQCDGEGTDAAHRIRYAEQEAYEKLMKLTLEMANQLSVATSVLLDGVAEAVDAFPEDECTGDFSLLGQLTWLRGSQPRQP